MSDKVTGFKPFYWGCGLALVAFALSAGWDAVEGQRVFPYRTAGNVPGLVLMAIAVAAMLLLVIGLFHKSVLLRLRWKLVLSLAMALALCFLFDKAAQEVWHVCPDAIYAPGSPQAKAVNIFKQYEIRRYGPYRQSDPFSNSMTITATSAPEGWIVYHSAEFCDPFGRRLGGRFLIGGTQLLLDKRTFQILKSELAQ